MRLKEFEESVMMVKKGLLKNLRIMSFRIHHGHVKSCLTKDGEKDAIIWDGEGKAYRHLLKDDERKLDDDEFVERFDYADTSTWIREFRMDIM